MRLHAPSALALLVLLTPMLRAEPRILRTDHVTVEYSAPEIDQTHAAALGGLTLIPRAMVHPIPAEDKPAGIMSNASFLP